MKNMNNRTQLVRVLWILPLAFPLAAFLSSLDAVASLVSEHGMTVQENRKCSLLIVLRESFKKKTLQN